MSTGTKYHLSRPEIWGGIECTINRVHDSFRDQLKDSGHYINSADIEQFAALGIRKLRYPVLWERHQPRAGQAIDWRWVANRLNLIRSNNITPVAGLLHHGSGPAYTSLADPDFPLKLAAYAARVAARFPWLEYYTPVNEPLTTARFSGLYGHWYPHRHSEKDFVQMLVNQLKGVLLSMQAIRRINPAAQLVQTEDLSKTHSTPLLAYQAAFENERRWLTADLLCGRVNRDHFFYDRLLALGIAEADLAFFQEQACPPDIMGFNYYVTSERYLDERTTDYPGCTHGGNGKHSYADTEAVRATKMAGLETLLTEAWHRYHRPMAIAECHLNCTREEQLRWFSETWQTACRLNKQGIAIQGVTAWALLGAYDWNSLLTCRNGHYEPGIFDIRNQVRRPTALAKMVRTLAAGKPYLHPLLAEKGWWHQGHTKGMKTTAQKTRPVLITGRNGTLAQAFIRVCERRSIPCVALSRQELDILKSEAIVRAIDDWKPWAVINTAGYVRVDDAETHASECFAANATGPGLLAGVCREKGIRLLSFSSDLVFDGEKNAPYRETDAVNPLNMYGASKAAGEKNIQAACPEALIIRTSAFFGPWDQYNFAHLVLQSLQDSRPIDVPDDVMISPTYVPDLADAALDLFIDEEKGIWHICNDGMLTWADFAHRIAEQGCHSTDQLIKRPQAEMGWKARRPQNSVLQSGKGIQLPQLDHALQRYFRERTI